MVFPHTFKHRHAVNNCAQVAGRILTGYSATYYRATWASSQYKGRLFQVLDSHVKDKTVARPSYL